MQMSPLQCIAVLLFSLQRKRSCIFPLVLQTRPCSHSIIQPLPNSSLGRKCWCEVLLGSIVTYIYRENTMGKWRETEQKRDLLCFCPISRFEKGTVDFSLRRSHSYKVAIIMTTIKIDFWSNGRESLANKNIRECFLHFMNYTLQHFVAGSV